MGRRRTRRWKKGGGEFPYVWTRLAKPKGRKGQRCKIIGKASVTDVVKVEFQDGREFYVARGGLQRASE